MTPLRQGRLARGLAIAGLAVVRPASAGEVGDVSGWCAAMRDATVQIRGDVALYADPAGTPDVWKDVRAGSGFWIAPGVVVTANHVVARMTGIRVCDASGGGCVPVDKMVGYADSDVAVLTVSSPPVARTFRIASPVGPGQAIVAGGFPADLGWVCGPGHLTGVTPSPVAGGPSYLLFDGTIAAEGSSGGPIAVIGRSPKKLEAIGAISGATTVGSVKFDRGAPLEDAVAKGMDEATHVPADWRKTQPWAETKDVPIELTPGKAYWEDLDVPALQDLELSAKDADGLCYGFYEPPKLLSAEQPVPYAWSCDGDPVLVTTKSSGPVRIGLWTDSAKGWKGTVTLRRR